MQQCGTLCSEEYDKFSAAINPFCDLFNSCFPVPQNDEVESILPKAVRGNKNNNSGPRQSFLMLLEPRVHCSFTLFDQLLGDFCQDFFAHDEDIALAKCTCTLTISNNEVNNNLMLHGNILPCSKHFLHWKTCQLSLLLLVVVLLIIIIILKLSPVLKITEVSSAKQTMLDGILAYLVLQLW